MVVVVEVKGLTRLNERLKKIRGLPKKIGVVNLRFARIVRDSLRQQFVSQRKKAARSRTAKRFKARKKGRYDAEVTMPLSALYLDSMKPHYVPLRRGTKITRWTKKYFLPRASFVKSRRSFVKLGPRGGVKGGAIYVTPDPFIDKGYNRVKNRLTVMLNKVVKEATRG